MKILVLSSSYEKFILNYNKKNKSSKLNFVEYQENLFKQSFGVNGFFRSGFEKLGLNSIEYICNDFTGQTKWILEFYGISFLNSLIDIFARFSFFKRVLNKLGYFDYIVLKQVEITKPDILYIHEYNLLKSKTLMELKKYTKIMVGHVGRNLKDLERFKNYDMVFTSHTETIEILSKLNIPVYYTKLGFHEAVINQIEYGSKKHFITYLGSLNGVHKEKTEEIVNFFNNHEFDFNIYGQGINDFDDSHPIHKFYRGEAFGIDMYQIIANSHIVLNRHAFYNGNNLRNYEVTGIGSLLLSDYQPSLDDDFEINEEILVYKDYRELENILKKLLNNPELILTIANAGMSKTRSSYTWEKRLNIVINTIEERLPHE